MSFRARSLALLSLAATAPLGTSISMHRVENKHANLATRVVDDTHTGIVNIGFANSEFVVNNLGGQGPMTNEAEELRFVLDFDFDDRLVKVDMVIEAETPYEGNVDKNIIVGEYTQINVAPGTNVSLKVSFHDHASGMPLILPQTALAIMDLDHGKLKDWTPAAFEAFLAGPLVSYGATPTTQVRISDVPDSDGYFFFNSSTFGSKDDNPQPGLPLTQEQMDRGVVVEFASTSHFRLQLFASEGRFGRTFLIGGGQIYAEPQIRKTTVGPCSDFERLDFSFSQVVGDLTRSSMRFTNVFPYSSQAVDLIVAADDDYVPFNDTMNGLYGKCGNVNLAEESSTELTFTFLDSASDATVQMEKFFFSLLDIDMTLEGIEQVKFRKSEWSNSWLSFNSSLKSVDSDGETVTYNATLFGSGETNPTDPLNLDEEQAATSITLFRRAPMGQFHISFTAKEGTHTGRNLRFAGRTNYVCPTLA